MILSIIYIFLISGTSQPFDCLNYHLIIAPLEKSKTQFRNCKLSNNLCLIYDLSNNLAVLKL